LNDKLGNEGRFGMSIFEMPKFLICGMEKPSKFSNPVNGDWRASFGLSSDEELEPSEEEDGDEEVDEAGDDGRLDIDSLSPWFSGVW